jgi:hypothetical protein
MSGTWDLEINYIPTEAEMSDKVSENLDFNEITD